MGEFLKQYWLDIQSDLPPKYPDDECRQGPFKSWGSVLCDIDMITKALKLLKPEKVIELGTFEALGTIKMAEAISSYTSIGRLWTFDSDEPLERENIKGVITSKIIKNWQEEEKWKEWKNVVAERRKNLDKMFDGCEIIYIDGLISETLPPLLKEIEHWDFCFHDSTHTTPEIRGEFDLLEPFTKTGSVIVFDDVPINDHAFYIWFTSNRSDTWDFQHSGKGHGQLWAEKK